MGFAEITEFTPFVQAGAVGIAILLIISGTYMFRLAYRLFSNHINHNTEALTELEKTISKHTTSTDRLIAFLERYLLEKKD